MKPNQIKHVKSRVRLLNFIVDFLPIQFLAGLLFGFLHEAYFNFLRHDDYSKLALSQLWPLYVTPAAKLFIICLAVANFVYYFFMESVFGSTIGKFVTSTKVVSMNDEKPKIGEIFLRTICRLIPFFDAASFLNTEKTGLHDSLSQTKLVKIKYIRPF